MIGKRAIYIDRHALEKGEPSIVLEESGQVVGRYTSIAGVGFVIKTHRAGDLRPDGQKGTRPKVWIEVPADAVLTKSG